MYHDDCKPIGAFKIAVVALGSKSFMQQPTERFVAVDEYGSPKVEKLYEVVETVVGSFLEDNTLEIQHVFEKHPTYWITHRIRSKEYNESYAVQVWKVIR